MAVVATALLLIILAKNLFTPQVQKRPGSTPQSAIQPVASDLETKVLLVTSEFVCAGGKRGRTPLVDCLCDQPRGAREEKTFIRAKLEEGKSVEEVILLVDKTYGNRI